VLTTRSAGDEDFWEPEFEKSCFSVDYDVADGDPWLDDSPEHR